MGWFLLAVGVFFVIGLHPFEPLLQRVEEPREWTCARGLGLARPREMHHGVLSGRSARNLEQNVISVLGHADRADTALEKSGWCGPTSRRSSATSPSGEAGVVHGVRNWISDSTDSVYYSCR